MKTYASMMLTFLWKLFDVIDLSLAFYNCFGYFVDVSTSKCFY